MTSTSECVSRNLIDCLFKDMVDKCTMECTSNAAPPCLASFHKAPEQTLRTLQSIHRLNRGLLITADMTDMGCLLPGGCCPGRLRVLVGAVLDREECGVARCMKMVIMMAECNWLDNCDDLQTPRAFGVQREVSKR